MHNQRTILKYEGRYTDMTGENRSWMILSHFIDVDGADRFKGSFALPTLRQLGVVPAITLTIVGGK